ncbi:hypothetical protein [Desulfosporosinus sp. I2]|uniref:hypothetical protein n=1 Tax=Desulfosporosinus sp. I2 TaxID=1617025 RepID=UPI0012E0177E|nr:hypothetical protein [Desulfosporosinus sp. I2]
MIETSPCPDNNQYSCDIYGTVAVTHNEQWFVKESITAGKITSDRMTVVIGSSIEHSSRKILANTQKSNGKMLK